MYDPTLSTDLLVDIVYVNIAVYIIKIYTPINAFLPLTET